MKRKLHFNRTHILTYKNFHINLIHYFLMLVFKAGMEYGYTVYLHNSPQIYPLDINMAKYLYGLIWLTVLFIFKSNGEEKVSAFILHFFYVFQMVPITIIYSLQNENTLFYNTICFSVLICELVVNRTSDICLQFNLSKKADKKWIIAFFLIVCSLFLLNVYKRNGLPTLTALDLYAVYELRSSGLYQISKYGHYMQDIVVKVLIPILISRFLINKQYIYLLIVFAIEGIIYLYVGEKSFLFTGIMVFCIVFWFSRKEIRKYFWPFFYLGLTTVCFMVKSHYFFEVIYDFFIRRIFIVSANNKFLYYDFFSTHPKEGFAGIFPRWLIPIRSNYVSGYPDGYTFQIGGIYYGQPEMDCNTGFLAEGFLRWGLIGIVIELLVLAFVLKCVDGFQRKTDFVFALGTSIVMIFGLGDGHLISPLLCGHLTVWFLFLLFYRRKVATVYRQAGRFGVGRLGIKETEKINL